MHAAAVITARCAWLTYNVAAESVCRMMPLPQLMTHAASMPAVACTALSYCHVNPLVVVHAPASCGRGLEGDGRSILEVMRRGRAFVRCHHGNQSTHSTQYQPPPTHRSRFTQSLG